MQLADGKRYWSIAWCSKQQSSTASSTCKAEMISMATALKSEALPLLDLFSEALTERSRLNAVKRTRDASRPLSRDTQRLYTICRESNELPWASLARRLSRMIVGSCTQSLRFTKEMTLRSGWCSLCSKQQ